jgi:hypothetical protein
MNNLEFELLKIASFYLNKKMQKRIDNAFKKMEESLKPPETSAKKSSKYALEEDIVAPSSGTSMINKDLLSEQLRGETSSLIDRQTLYSDILECECVFQRSKRRVIDMYVEVC